MRETVGVFLVRVALPDRPGSLGSVAAAMGQLKADIHAVEVVERYEGFAVDDFMVELPAGSPADALVTVCESVPDVSVLWVSHYPEAWGLQGDVDLLNAMTEDPEHAEEILALQAPAVFRVSWAVLVDTDSGAVLAKSELAPDLDAAGVGTFGALDGLRTDELADGWLPGWPAMLIVVAPTRRNAAIVLARRGGPEFLASELARLRHLAALAM